MAGYVRADTTNNISDGSIINAADLDNEFDALVAAFNSDTGHTHDGTTGSGASITNVGPSQDVVISSTTITPKTTNIVDIGSTTYKFKNLFLSGNGSVAGTFAISSTLGVTGALTVGGNLITNVSSAAPSLSTNRTMSFELTSNTSLKVVVRGTDGVTRSVSLTLA